MNSQPFVSVIVPVYNGSAHIERCLDALVSSSYSSFEIIVVDDCSTDDTVSKAGQMEVNILRLQKQAGPGAARHFGVQHARGEILLFVDSDVIVRKDTIARVVDDFKLNPDIVALFGSYDDDPGETNFISQYKNLFHHYHHQEAASEAFTFWAGCGAILKKVYLEMGGFDVKRYERPSIEDIELGYRISKKGYRIILDKKLQVKHLKRWDLSSLIRTDIFQRAIPWSRLILETKFMPNDLNLKISHKISSLTTFLMTLLIPLIVISSIKYQDTSVNVTSGIILAILFIVFLIMNRDLYKFYLRNRGFMFTVKVILFHILYYLYSGISFIYCWIRYRIFVPRA